MTVPSTLLCPAFALRENRLDGFRLALALLVIFSHSFPLTTGHYHAEPLSWLTGQQLSLGNLAVDCFFVISGFLIVRSWLTSGSMQDYFRRRILRIHPAFIVAMVFSMALAAVTCPTPIKYLEAMPWAQFVRGLFTFDYAILDVKGLAYPENPDRAVNGSLWTINVEFLAYTGVAIYGLFGLFRYRRLWLVLAAADYAVYLHKVVRHGGPADFHWRLGCFFIAGATVYLFRDLLPRSRTWCAGALVLLLGSFFMPLGLHLVLPLILPYLLFYFTLRAPRSPVVRGRADLSYGTYLYAFPVQQALVHTLHLKSPWLLFALAFPVTLLLASASWHLIEKPFLALKSRDFSDEDPSDLASEEPGKMTTSVPAVSEAV